MRLHRFRLLIRIQNFAAARLASDAAGDLHPLCLQQARSKSACLNWKQWVVAFLLCVTSRGVWADETQVPEQVSLALPSEIKQALQQNAAALTPLAMKFRVDYTTDRTVDEAVKAGKLTWGKYFFEPTLVDLHLDGVKFSCRREVTRESAAGNPVQMIFWNRFDGQDYYNLNEPFPGATPGVTVYPYKQWRGFTVDMEYVHRAGFQRHDTRNLEQAPDESLVLERIGRGLPVVKAEPVTFDGKELFLIEIANEKSQHLIYLDPARQYALAIYDGRNSQGQQIRHTVNSDFVEFTDPHIWLPRRCETVWHTWSTMEGKLTEKPLVTEVITVTEIDKRPLSISQFQRDLTQPGLGVGDARLAGAENHEGGMVQYQVPANLNHLDGVIAAAIDKKEFKPPLIANTGVKIIILLNVLMVIGGLFWLWRRQKKAQ
jgi:hypothetical protein